MCLFLYIFIGPEKGRVLLSKLYTKYSSQKLSLATYYLHLLNTVQLYYSTLIHPKSLQSLLSIQCLSGPEKAISSVKSFDIFNIVLSIIF